jgi:murein DD-endopeptidase MepM/ murein hydrolase activator NlpD
VISTRRLVALRGLVLGIAACSSPAPRVGVVAVVPPRPGTPIPSAVEFRVPKAPTVANSDSGTFVGYELHVTNLTPGAMSLRRVEVLDADKGTVLSSLADSALLRAVARAGAPVPIAERLQIGGGLRAYVYLWMPVEAGSPLVRLRHRLTLRKLTGDSATEVLDGAEVPVERAAVAIGAPLRGEWAAFNGPSNASGHRRLVMAFDGHVASGQRYAIDFLQVDSIGGSRRPGSDASKNANYYAYGSELYAVADGVVLATKDSIPENVPGANSRAVPINLVTVGGNYVGIDIGNGKYALYAHIQPGTLRVKVGDRVKRGQVVGLLGNSGNSTEPHLHFQVADAPVFLSSEGVPYATDFEVLGNCGIGGNPPAIRCTRHAPTAVKGGIPLQNELVRFPR